MRGKNTYDWSNVKTDQAVWLKQSVPYNTDNISSMLENREFYINQSDYEYHGEVNYLIDCNISYYPNSYLCDECCSNRHPTSEPEVFTSLMAPSSFSYISTSKTEPESEHPLYVRFPRYGGYAYNLERGQLLLLYDFRPLKKISTEKFHLFGHDITITPELLSGNIVAQPELTEQEKYIKQLEEENAKLKTENEQYREIINTNKDEIIKNLESEKEMLEDTLYQYKLIDYNGNGKLDVDDSQMILMYYVNTLAGKYTGTIEDYALYRNDKAYESVHISGGI